MVSPEHARQIIKTYCTAESAKDRDTWLALFAPDATHEDPIGAPVNHGVEAIGAFFDAGAGQMDLDLHMTGEPIVLGNEALAVPIWWSYAAAQILITAGFFFDRDALDEPDVERRRPDPGSRRNRAA